MAYEVKAQYGSPIPTTKDTEKAIVQHAVVNGRERIEVRLRWVNDERGGNVSYTDRFGKRQSVCITLDTQDALDDLIGALETVRLDFKESAPATKAAAGAAKASPPVKPIVGRGKAVQAKARAARATRAKKAS